MTTTNFISDDTSVLSFVAANAYVSPNNPNNSNTVFLLQQLVNNIPNPYVQNIVGSVFKDLLRLLECLNFVEVHLRKIESAPQTFALFELIHDEASALVTFIKNDCLKPELGSDELFDTLDGIAFAVGHDLQRVFEARSGIQGNAASTHVIIGRLYKAHDVLTNCLQQSAITLAMIFDGELDGTKLFNNSDMRFRQSLQLCSDLSRLIQLVESTEDGPEMDAVAGLYEGIQKFRNESMEFLMYTDWPEFESFCDRFDTTDSAQLKDALHQFRCYLETLLSQVRMRAVLSNVFPLGFGDDRFSALATDSTSDQCEMSGLAMAI